jgi:hypothetical protein
VNPLEILPGPSRPVVYTLLTTYFNNPTLYTRYTNTHSASRPYRSYILTIATNQSLPRVGLTTLTALYATSASALPLLLLLLLSTLTNLDPALVSLH